MASKRLQALDQVRTGKIEILVNVFQASGSNRLNSDESSFDAGSFHRTEKFDVFGGFHGDLSE